MLKDKRVEVSMVTKAAYIYLLRKKCAYLCCVLYGHIICICVNINRQSLLQSCGEYIKGLKKMVRVRFPIVG